MSTKLKLVQRHCIDRTKRHSSVQCVPRIMLHSMGIHRIAIADPEEVNTLRKVTDLFRDTGLLHVERTNSLSTIWGHEDNNLYFRAWHDWVHIIWQLPFDLESERKVRAIQQDQVEKLRLPKSRLICDILEIEIDKQGEYYKEFGCFVENQYEFTLNKLHEKGYLHYA